MGQIWLWNLGFMAELWGKNSATDNPPRPMILIPAHTPSAHASSGFRLQVRFRAVFGGAATVMPSLSYQCAGPLYVERINVSVQASPRGTTRFYAVAPLSPRHPLLLPTPNASRSTHHPSHPNADPPSHQLEWAAVSGPGLLDHQVESLFGHQVLQFGQVLGDDRVPPQGGSQL